MGTEVIRPALRMDKASVYHKTGEMIQVGEQLLAQAEQMSQLVDELTRELLTQAALYSKPEERTRELDTAMIDWFMVHDLALCDAYAVLRSTVKALVINKACRPGPVYTDVMLKVYGAERSPLTLAHGKGSESDPFAGWITRSGEGVTDKLETENAVLPYTEALIQLFKSRNLTVREALAVIAQVESGLLNAPVL